MVDQLIIVGTWVLMSAFFLLWNIKQRGSVGKFVSWWLMVISAFVALVLLIKLSAEYF